MSKVHLDTIGFTTLVAKQDIDWSFFRVMVCSNGERTGKVMFGYPGDGKMKFGFIRRADLAEVLLDEVTERRWVKQMPLIKTA